MNRMEEGLFESARNGDVEAFERLTEEYHKKIYGMALKVAKNRKDANEMAQQVFVEVYKSIDTLKAETAFPILIYRIAANICINGSDAVK